MIRTYVPYIPILMRENIGKVAQLIYLDSKGAVSIRNIKVLMVGDKRFMAFCYKAKEVRTFIKSGVVDIEVLRFKNREGVQEWIKQ